MAVILSNFFTFALVLLPALISSLELSFTVFRLLAIAFLPFMPPRNHYNTTSNENPVLA